MKRGPMVRRAAMALILALIIQMMIGAAAGSGSWQCLCTCADTATSGIGACCTAQIDLGHDGSQPETACECSACLAPVSAPPMMAAQAAVPFVLGGPQVLLGRLSWPTVARMADRRRSERPPAHQHLRSLRSVILVC